ncbi:hypothetical protein PUN4_140082 [Paraburkholderia unamae]|nr:hypothetical protein PUN4_140082 [Paraburkholderia unamae]
MYAGCAGRLGWVVVAAALGVGRAPLRLSGGRLEHMRLIGTIGDLRGGYPCRGRPVPWHGRAQSHLASGR